MVSPDEFCPPRMAWATVVQLPPPSDVWRMARFPFPAPPTAVHRSHPRVRLTKDTSVAVAASCGHGTDLPCQVRPPSDVRSIRWDPLGNTFPTPQPSLEEANDTLLRSVVDRWVQDRPPSPENKRWIWQVPMAHGPLRAHASLDPCTATS